jgi:hypothetical protein
MIQFDCFIYAGSKMSTNGMIGVWWLPLSFAAIAGILIRMHPGLMIDQGVFAGVAP